MRNSLCNSGPGAANGASNSQGGPVSRIKVSDVPLNGEHQLLNP